VAADTAWSGEGILEKLRIRGTLNKQFADLFSFIPTRLCKDLEMVS